MVRATAPHAPAMLIISGSGATKIGLDDATHLKQSDPDASLQSTLRADNLATYHQPGLPLAPGLVEAIAAFVHKG